MVNYVVPRAGMTINYLSPLAVTLPRQNKNTFFFYLQEKFTITSVFVCDVWSFFLSCKWRDVQMPLTLTVTLLFTTLVYGTEMTPATPAMCRKNNCTNQCFYSFSFFFFFFWRPGGKTPTAHLKAIKWDFSPTTNTIGFPIKTFETNLPCWEHLSLLVAWLRISTER